MFEDYAHDRAIFSWMERERTPDYWHMIESGIEYLKIMFTPELEKKIMGAEVSLIELIAIFDKAGDEFDRLRATHLSKAGPSQRSR